MVKYKELFVFIQLDGVALIQLDEYLFDKRSMPMEWKVNRQSAIPLYQQIYEWIEQKIAYGEFPPGTLLLSERKLAEQLQVNRMTVVHVYEELHAAGLVERKRGSGTRVSGHKWGILPKGATNWRRYVEGNSFLPTYPLIKQIREKAKQMDSGFDLASGELSADLFPSSLLQASFLKEPFPSDLGYEHPQGHLALRETITAHMKHHYGVDTTSSSILITSGAQQALYLLTQCLLSPGDTVAIESPSYYYSLPLFQSAGLRIVALPVDAHGINPDDLIALHEKHPIRMVFLNPTYQNPTGTVLSEARRKKVLSVSAELGIPVVEDDPFSLLSFENKKTLPIKSYDQSGNVLYIGSLSKIAASSLRIGWLIGPQSVISRLADARQQMDFGLSIFPQLIAHQFLQSTDYPEHLHSLRQELLARRNEMVSTLQEVLGTEVEFTVPNGGLYIWCKLKKSIDDRKLVQECMKHHVLYLPGSVYGFPDGYARFTYARLKQEAIKEAIKRFAKALSCM